MDPQGSLSPTPGSTQDHPTFKPYAWEHCPNAPWTPAVWHPGHCHGQPVPCPLPSDEEPFPDIYLKSSGGFGLLQERYSKVTEVTFTEANIPGIRYCWIQSPAQCSRKLWLNIYPLPWWWRLWPQSNTSWWIHFGRLTPIKLRKPPLADVSLLSGLCCSMSTQSTECLLPCCVLQ